MTLSNHKLLLGGHMSIAGGFEQALIKAHEINTPTLQIFTKSNRQWVAKPITQDQAELFKKTTQQMNISTIMAHASYLINIGSPDKSVAQKATTAVIQELERCHQLSINLLALHPGAHLASSIESCLKRISENLNSIFAKTPHISTVLLLENMAGQGSTVGFKFEHLATIINEVENKHRIGVCFDTCHAFAAGYTFNTPTTYATMWKEFDYTIGLKHLKAFHINDSKKEGSSHVDRHAEIGDGLIGLEAFRLLFNDKRFFDIPKILETPLGFTGYPANISRIKSLISDSNKKLLGV